MKSIKTLTIAFVLFACTVLLASCANKDAGMGLLKVGVRGNVANFGLYDEDADLYFGMDIDLANMLADDLGYSGVEYVRVYPETRESALESGDVDCVIACYTITDERKKTVDFSPEYYTDKTVVMVEKSSLITEVSGLKGAKIGYLTNTNSKGVVESTLPQGYMLKFVEYEDYDDMIAALEYGKIDAVTDDKSLCLNYMNEDRLILPNTFANQPFGVATKKGSKLSPRIAELILKYKEDGQLKELSEKWQ